MADEQLRAAERRWTETGADDDLSVLVMARKRAGLDIPYGMRVRMAKLFTSLGTNVQGLDEFRHKTTGMVFVMIPGGEFMMGGNGENETKHKRGFDEPFLVAKYPWTGREWYRVTGELPSHFPTREMVTEWMGVTPVREDIIYNPEIRMEARDSDGQKWGDHPVESVSWDRCREVEDWINRIDFARQFNSQFGIQVQNEEEKDGEITWHTWLDYEYDSTTKHRDDGEVEVPSYSALVFPKSVEPLYQGWLWNEKGERAGFQLPTESMWEYAARAGTTTRYPNGDSDEDLAKIAWFGGQWEDGHKAVGLKGPNNWGLHDNCGNVFEWTRCMWRQTVDESPTNGFLAVGEERSDPTDVPFLNDMIIQGLVSVALPDSLVVAAHEDESGSPSGRNPATSESDPAGESVSSDPTASDPSGGVAEGAPTVPTNTETSTTEGSASSTVVPSHTSGSRRPGERDSSDPPRLPTPAAEGVTTTPQSNTDDRSTQPQDKELAPDQPGGVGEPGFFGQTPATGSTPVERSSSPTEGSATSVAELKGGDTSTGSSDAMQVSGPSSPSAGHTPSAPSNGPQVSETSSGAAASNLTSPADQPGEADSSDPTTKTSPTSSDPYAGPSSDQSQTSGSPGAETSTTRNSDEIGSSPAIVATQEVTVSPGEDDSSDPTRGSATSQSPGSTLQESELTTSPHGTNTDADATPLTQEDTGPQAPGSSGEDGDSDFLRPGQSTSISQDQGTAPGSQQGGSSTETQSLSTPPSPETSSSSGGRGILSSILGSFTRLTSRLTSQPESEATSPSSRATAGTPGQEKRASSESVSTPVLPGTITGSMDSDRPGGAGSGGPFVSRSGSTSSSEPSPSTAPPSGMPSDLTPNTETPSSRSTPTTPQPRSDLPSRCTPTTGWPREQSSSSEDTGPHPQDCSPSDGTTQPIPTTPTGSGESEPPGGLADRYAAYEHMDPGEYRNGYPNPYADDAISPVDGSDPTSPLAEAGTAPHDSSTTGHHSSITRQQTVEDSEQPGEDGSPDPTMGLSTPHTSPLTTRPTSSTQTTLRSDEGSAPDSSTCSLEEGSSKSDAAAGISQPNSRRSDIDPGPEVPQENPRPHGQPGDPVSSDFPQGSPPCPVASSSSPSDRTTIGSLSAQRSPESLDTSTTTAQTECSGEASTTPTPETSSRMDGTSGLSTQIFPTGLQDSVFIGGQDRTRFPLGIGQSQSAAPGTTQHQNSSHRHDGTSFNPESQSAGDQLDEGSDPSGERGDSDFSDDPSRTSSTSRLSNSNSSSAEETPRAGSKLGSPPSEGVNSGTPSTTSCLPSSVSNPLPDQQDSPSTGPNGEDQDRTPGTPDVVIDGMLSARTLGVGSFSNLVTTTVGSGPPGEGGDADFPSATPTSTSEDTSSTSTPETRGPQSEPYDRSVIEDGFVTQLPSTSQEASASAEDLPADSASVASESGQPGEGGDSDFSSRERSAESDSQPAARTGQDYLPSCSGRSDDSAIPSDTSAEAESGSTGTLRTGLQETIGSEISPVESEPPGEGGDSDFPSASSLATTSHHSGPTGPARSPPPSQERTSPTPSSEPQAGSATQGTALSEILAGLRSEWMTSPSERPGGAADPNTFQPAVGQYVNKWAPLLDGVDDTFTRRLTALMLEQESRHLQQIQSEIDGGVDRTFLQYALPLISARVPPIFQPQPMLGPVGGLAFYRPEYRERLGPVCCGASWDEDFSADYTGPFVRRNYYAAHDTGSFRPSWRGR